MSYIDEWRAKLRKVREAEAKKDREKRGVKIIVIGGPKK